MQVNILSEYLAFEVGEVELTSSFDIDFEVRSISLSQLKSVCFCLVNEGTDSETYMIEFKLRNGCLIKQCLVNLGSKEYLPTYAKFKKLKKRLKKSKYKFKFINELA